MIAEEQLSDAMVSSRNSHCRIPDWVAFKPSSLVPWHSALVSSRMSPVLIIDAAKDIFLSSIFSRSKFHPPYSMGGSAFQIYCVRGQSRDHEGFGLFLQCPLRTVVKASEDLSYLDAYPTVQTLSSPRACACGCGQALSLFSGILSSVFAVGLSYALFQPVLLRP
jgi:hypothetical protein